MNAIEHASPPPSDTDGRRRAFEVAYSEHGVAVLNYVVRRCTSREDALDAAAETFLVAWRKRAELPADPAQALPWLFTTARWVLANQTRGERRRVRLGAQLAAEIEHAGNEFPDPSHLHDARGNNAALRRALDQLATDDRELLLLVAWDGLSVGDAGSVLGWNAGQARVRLHRARHRLRLALSNDPHYRLDPK